MSAELHPLVMPGSAVHGNNDETIACIVLIIVLIFIQMNFALVYIVIFTLMYTEK